MVNIIWYYYIPHEAIPPFSGPFIVRLITNIMQMFLKECLIVSSQKLNVNSILQIEAQYQIWRRNKGNVFIFDLQVI